MTCVHSITNASYICNVDHIIISIMLISLFIFNIGGGGTFVGTYLFLLKYFTYIKYFYIGIIIMIIMYNLFELILLHLFINKKINISAVLPDFVID